MVRLFDAESVASAGSEGIVASGVPTTLTREYDRQIKR
jgi:hypothetical protein